jgi:hypothetical protein
VINLNFETPQAASPVLDPKETLLQAQEFVRQLKAERDTLQAEVAMLNDQLAGRDRVIERMKAEHNTEMEAAASNFERDMLQAQASIEHVGNVASYFYAQLGRVPGIFRWLFGIQVVPDRNRLGPNPAQAPAPDAASRT